MSKFGLIYEPSRQTNLKFASYVSSTMTLPAVLEDYSLAMPSAWDSLGNSRWGDCVPAMGGHYFQQVTSRMGCLINPDAAGVLADYSELTGFDPLNPLTDRGTTMASFMSHLKNSGMIVKILTKTVKNSDGTKTAQRCPQRLGIDAYVEVDSKDLGRLKAACYVAGGILLATVLPNKMANGASLYGSYWDTTPTFSDGGSRGTHAIFGHFANESGVKINSWGSQKLMTEAFLQRYCYQAFAPISVNWLGKNLQAANGFDLTKMRAELAKVSK